MRSILCCQRIRSSILCIASLPASQSAFAQTQATFQGLGDLPGGSVLSYVTAVSADGLVVVGASEGTAGIEAFRWTLEGGMIGLGDFEGGEFFSRARAVSGDGSVVVGESETDKGHQAFLWRMETPGLVGIGELPGGNHYSSARGVSDDGAVVVGKSSATLGSFAFRWTSTGGMVNLGDLYGGSNWSVARACSGFDGAVMVGTGSSSQALFEALRWNSSGNMYPMGDFSGGLMLSEATDVSFYGNVIVGYGVTTDGQRAFRWTNATGLVNLGTLGSLEDANNGSLALGVSMDGSVVVGSSENPSSQAFVWNEAFGMRSLNDLLVQYGLDLTGWTLLRASDVSSDGRVIVGSGLNPLGVQEGWIAMLPPPCPADSDASQSVDVVDLLDLLATWGPCGPPCPEDNDGNGTVDVLDLLALLTTWGPCP